MDDREYDKTHYVNIIIGIAVIVIVASRLTYIGNKNYTDNLMAIGISLLFTAEGHLCQINCRLSYIKEFVIRRVLFFASFFLTGLIVDYICSDAAKDGMRVEFSDILSDKYMLIPGLIVCVVCYRLLRSRLNIAVTLILCMAISVGGQLYSQNKINDIVSLILREFGYMLYIALGEAACAIYEKNEKLKMFFIVLSICLIEGGAVIITYTSIPIVPFAMICVGLSIMCKWIEVFTVIEKCGEHWLLIWGSSLMLGIMDLAMRFDSYIFKMTNHNFISHFLSTVLLICCEMLFIWIFEIIVKIRKKGVKGADITKQKGTE